jgi:hypothetical protein
MSTSGKPRLVPRPGVSWWALPVGASLLAWAVLFAVFSPADQNLPLNDDWAFARSAFAFARGEGIHYGGWASMPQLGQWVWACPYLWLLGESHFALRVSTIVLSWLGLWACYDLLKQEKVTPYHAALATATLAFNPMFFLLQGTFMTDVPALSLALVALALLVRGLDRQSMGWLAGGCLVALLAVATRQNTLAVPVTAGILLWRGPLRRRPDAWLIVLLPVVVGLAVHFWFQGRTDVRALRPRLPAPDGLLALPYLLLHWCGLAALPLLLYRPRIGSWPTFGWVFAMLVACAGYWLLYGRYLPYGGLFPYTENMLSPNGALAGSRFTGLLIPGERPVLLGTTLRVLLTLLGCLSAALLFMRIQERWRAGTWMTALTIFTLLQLPFLLIAPDFYDRYVLFLIPGALAVAAPIWQPTAKEPPQEPERVGAARFAALAVLVLFALASVGLMHDWLAWNAARWAVGRRALAHHVDPLDIEGGVEWDGWYAGLRAATEQPPPRKWPVLPFTADWFPTVRGHYALSFSQVRGSRVLDSEPYTLWLSLGPRQFYFLEVPPLPSGRPNTSEPTAPPRSADHRD